MGTGWRDARGAGEAERTLVLRMLAGDAAAFDLFADAYLPPLYRFAQRRLGDRELTREVVQSTVCKAIAGLRGFRGESELTTWLIACCRNEIAAHFRRQGRAGEEVELAEETVGAGAEAAAHAAPGPEQRLLGKERSALVHAALDELPSHYGRALEWKYLDHLRVEEIAARLGVRTKAAESLLTRARQAFRDSYRRLESGRLERVGAARERSAP